MNNVDMFLIFKYGDEEDKKQLKEEVGEEVYNQKYRLWKYGWNNEPHS